MLESILRGAGLGRQAIESGRSGRRDAFGRRLGRPAARRADVPVRPLSPAVSRRSNLPRPGAVQPAMKLLIAASLLTLSVAFPADSVPDQPSSGRGGDLRHLAGPAVGFMAQAGGRALGLAGASTRRARATMARPSGCRSSRRPASAASSSPASDVRFALRRDAGTLEFEGAFDAGRGTGTFRFAPNAAFMAALQKTGRQLSADDALRLAIHDVSQDVHRLDRDRPATRAWASKTSSRCASTAWTPTTSPACERPVTTSCRLRT